MKRFALAAAAAVAITTCSSSAQAATSMFARSYYSHDPVRAVKVGSNPGSVPNVNAANGGYIRAGYRRLQSRLPDRYGSGQINMYFEAWGNTGRGIGRGF